MAKAAILKDLIEELRLNVLSFENAIGVKRGRVSNAIIRNSDIKTDLVEIIVEKFPEVNKNWLVSGEGEMFLDITPKASTKKEVKVLGKQVPLRVRPEDYAEAFGDWQGLPMYNTPITASFVETYRDEQGYEPQYFLHDPRFRDCDFGAIITGDSMHSEIRHGDFIACKEVTDRRFLVYGDIYYIVATNGLETCKYVNVDPHNEERLILVAKNDKISPSPLPKDMILRMYKVRGIIRGY